MVESALLSAPQQTSLVNARSNSLLQRLQFSQLHCWQRYSCTTFANNFLIIIIGLLHSQHGHLGFISAWGTCPRSVSKTQRIRLGYRTWAGPSCTDEPQVPMTASHVVSWMGWESGGRKENYVNSFPFDFFILHSLNLLIIQSRLWLVVEKIEEMMTN